MTPDNYKSLLEIIDSAIKIGLGALIGALASLTTILIQDKLERRSGWKKRNLEMLERVAIEFEDIHNSFVDMNASFSSYCELIPINPLAADLAYQKLMSLLGGPAKSAITKLTRLNGSLSLYGENTALAAINLYGEKSLSFYELISAAAQRSDQSQANVVTEACVKLIAERAKVFAELHKCIKKGN